MPAPPTPMERINAERFRLHEPSQADHRNAREYRGWTLQWAGWMPLWNQDSIVSRWVGYKDGEPRAAVSPWPGRPQLIREYECIDLEPLPGQFNPCRLYHRKHGDDAYVAACDKARDESLARLLELIDSVEDAGPVMEPPLPTGQPLELTDDRACVACKTSLNRTDVNCWRCGGTEIR